MEGSEPVEGRKKEERLRQRIEGKENQQTKLNRKRTFPVKLAAPFSIPLPEKVSIIVSTITRAVPL